MPDIATRTRKYSEDYYGAALGLLQMFDAVDGYEKELPEGARDFLTIGPAWREAEEACGAMGRLMNELDPKADPEMAHLADVVFLCGAAMVGLRDSVPQGALWVTGAMHDVLKRAITAVEGADHA